MIEASQELELESLETRIEDQELKRVKKDMGFFFTLIQTSFHNRLFDLIRNF